MRVYYDDGSVHEGWDGPAWGVEFVAWPDPVVGSDFCYGRSYFIRAPWLDGQPLSVDLGGLYDYLIAIGSEWAWQPMSEIPPQALIDDGVKFGRTISAVAFHALLQRVKAETDWTGQYPHRKPDRVLV